MTELTLFNQVINTNQRRVSPSSVDSFYSDNVQKKRLTQKDRIYLACKKLGLANDRMMSEVSGVPRFLVPDRRGQLVKKDKVLRFVVNKMDTTTGENTDFYEVVE